MHFCMDIVIINYSIKDIRDPVRFLMHSYDDLILFVNVVDQRTFTQAATTLKLSQSTISRRIRLLEESLGFKLFFQDGVGVKLTEAGHSLYRSVKAKFPTFNFLDQEIEALQSDKVRANGELFVCLPSSIAMQLITPYLPIFMNKYPDIELNLIFQSGISDFEMVRDNFDIVVTNHMPNSNHQKEYRIIKLLSLEAGLYCTPEYINKYGEPQTIQDLTKHRLIGNIRNDKFKDRLVVFKNTVTGEFETILGGIKSNLWTNDYFHIKKILESNEFIVAQYLDINHVSKLCRILPDYVVEDTNKLFSSIYLVKHPYKEHLASRLFSEFIQTIFKLFKSGCCDIKHELMCLYEI